MFLVPTHPTLTARPKRVIELATTTPALLISPAYRLIPESTGGDVLDDIQDFWTWLHSPSFPSSLRAARPDLTFSPDADRIAAVGESAGGYLCLQSAFLFNAQARIKAVMATYPAQYPDIQAYQPPPDPAEVDAKADAVVSEYQERVQRGELGVRVSTPWPEMRELVMAMVKTGRHGEMMGSDERLTLRYGLEMAERGKLPVIWVIQGADDDFVGETPDNYLRPRLTDLENIGSKNRCGYARQQNH